MLKLKFDEKLYVWTPQLEEGQVEACVRSLKENRCGDVHRVGLRVRYVRPEDCIHYIVVATVEGRIVFKDVRRTYEQTVVAVAAFLGDDGPAAQELLYCEMLNHRHNVPYARADQIIISPCSCVDPEGHTWATCPACGRDIASGKVQKPDLLLRIENCQPREEIRLFTRNSAASCCMVNELLAYFCQRSLPETDKCSLCAGLESALIASPKNEVRS